MVTLTGNKCGDSDPPGQSHGISQFTVVGNTCFFNTVGISNAAGTSASKVVMGNAT
jgi:hypothetical protein